MKKLKTKFIPATVFCSALVILVFQFGCQVAQTQVNSPSSLLTTATPTPEVVLPKVEPELSNYTGNVAVNSARSDDIKQDNNARLYADFKIKGVGIGTSEAKVLQKLGKPSQSKKSSVDEVCAGEFQKTLRYSGVAFGLSSDDEGRNYSVIAVDVTSSKWMDEPVAKIGANAKDVKAALGQPHNKRTEEDQTIFYYNLLRHDGGAKLFFQNRKLTRISWSLNFC